MNFWNISEEESKVKFSVVSVASWSFVVLVPVFHHVEVQHRSCSWTLEHPGLLEDVCAPNRCDLLAYHSSDQSFRSVSASLTKCWICCGRSCVDFISDPEGPAVCLIMHVYIKAVSQIWNILITRGRCCKHISAEPATSGGRTDSWFLFSNWFWNDQNFTKRDVVDGSDRFIHGGALQFTGVPSQEPVKMKI